LVFHRWLALFKFGGKGSANADFVCAMEDILEVYHQPWTEENPTVCVDETSRQQVKETRLPQPVQPTQPQRYDYEYERNGVSNLFQRLSGEQAKPLSSVGDTLK